MTADGADFLARFEAATIPNSAFRHRDHLRMAWLIHAGLLDGARARRQWVEPDLIPLP